MEQEEDGCGESALPGPTEGSPPASLEPQTQTPVAAGLESPVVSTHTARAPWGLYPIRTAPLQPPVPESALGLLLQALHLAVCTLASHFHLR